MDFNFEFFLNSVLLGASFAMDAFSVSLTNGLNEPKMKEGKIALISGVFSIFQFAMPLIGWFCISSMSKCFSSFEKAIPWIALVLLLFIGGKMLFEGVKNEQDEESKTAVTFSALIVQGVATSIDALSGGVTISDYNLIEALSACFIIAAVTFLICVVGVYLGKAFGTKLAGKANILGGVILIAIGIKIFVQGVF